MFDSVVAKLKQRFIGELPLWRLNVWQFLLLLLLAIWPWLSMWVIPNNKWLAFAPVIVFMPFAYVGGAMLTQEIYGRAFIRGRCQPYHFLSGLSCAN